MGKLLSLQSKLQQSVESVISKGEDQYLSLVQKSAQLTDKFYDKNKEVAIKACVKLQELNGKAGEAAVSLISKVEKEPTTEEKAKNAVDKAAEATKSMIEKTAEQAAKVASKVERVTEEALS